MKQDPKKLMKVKKMAVKDNAKNKPLPFWMKSKMGMKKGTAEPDADEKGGASDMDKDDYK